MNNSAHTSLMLEILNSQVPQRPDQDLSDRLKKAIDEDQPISLRDKKEIWKNPSARDLFLQLRKIHTETKRSELRNIGWPIKINPLAAAGSTGDVTISTEEFKVLLIPHKLGEKTVWTVSIQLSDRTLKNFPKNTVCSLKSDDNRIWALGKPDQMGRFSSDWGYEDISPIELLAKVELTLDIS